MGDKTVVSRLAFTSVEGVLNHRKRGDLPDGRISGEHSPPLQRKPPAQWSAPEPLFNDKDLSGWAPFGSGQNHWGAEEGALVNAGAGAHLLSARKLEDFKLLVEFNCPQGAGSGILRCGRCELQIEYAVLPAPPKPGRVPRHGGPQRCDHHRR